MSLTFFNSSPALGVAPATTLGLCNVEIIKCFIEPRTARQTDTRYDESNHMECFIKIILSHGT